MRPLVYRSAKFAAGVLLMLAAGCAELGQRVSHTTLPPGAPSSDEVLRDLADNDALIQSFRAGGSFEIASPEFEAVKQFRGNIRFRRPADLYVQGNHRLTNIVIFKLACVGQEFLMEFPNSKDQSFYQVEGEQFDNVPFSVSPSDIAREMFLPEDWTSLKRRDAHVIDFNPTDHVATISIGDNEKPRRVLEVMRVDDQAPKWVLRKNTRMTDDGKVLAVTTLDDYTNVSGALFPTKVEATFPTEETRMKFVMRSVELNAEVQDKYFNIRERARELNLQQRQANSQ